MFLPDFFITLAFAEGDTFTDCTWNLHIQVVIPSQGILQKLDFLGKLFASPIPASVKGVGFIDGFCILTRIVQILELLLQEMQAWIHHDDESTVIKL